MAYEIEFAESVQTHFRALTARERVTVLDTIERHLLHEPLKETRHRKPAAAQSDRPVGTACGAAAGVLRRDRR